MIADEKNMSPEEKKKYLEELRKQLDPEILKKMAGHMGGGDAGAALASMGSLPAEDNIPSSGSSTASSKFSTPSDIMKERRAMQFQERVAQRKREMELQETTHSEEETSLPVKALIYSSTEIWARIVDNQLKSVGLSETRCFYEFQMLIRHLIECYNNNCLDTILVAVALKDAKGFVHSWNRLTLEQENSNKLAFLKQVPFVVVVESQKQIPDNQWHIHSQDHILSLTDDLDTNQEKIKRLIVSNHNNNQ